MSFIARKVLTGKISSYFPTNPGPLFGWGDNSSFQLGIGNNTDQSSPVQIGSLSWSQISAGNNHTIGIRSDGLLFAWGYNAQGQLGTGDVVNYSSPVQIGSLSWNAVSGKFNTSLAIE